MGLDDIEILMDVEKYFGVQLPDQDVEDCPTVGHLIDIVLEKTDRSKFSERQVKNQIRRIIAYQMSIRLKDVRRESTWVELGVHL